MPHAWNLDWHSISFRFPLLRSFLSKNEMNLTPALSAMRSSWVLSEGGNGVENYFDIGCVKGCFLISCSACAGKRCCRSTYPVIWFQCLLLDNSDVRTSPVQMAQEWNTRKESLVESIRELALVLAVVFILYAAAYCAELSFTISTDLSPASGVFAAFFLGPLIDFSYLLGLLAILLIVLAICIDWAMGGVRSISWWCRPILVAILILLIVLFVGSIGQIYWSELVPALILIVTGLSLALFGLKF